MTVRSLIGPLVSMPFDNDLNVVSPYSINFMVGGTVFDSVFSYDANAGTYTDETVDAGDVDTNDVNLTSWVGGANATVEDAMYYGASSPFNEIALELSTTSGASTRTLIMEYFNGTTWTTVTGLTDNSTSYTADAGIYHLYWTAPTNWQKTSVNSSSNYFYVRYRISAYTSQTAQPKARQMKYFMSNKSDWKINNLKLTFDAASTAQIQPYLHSSNGRSYDFMLDDTTLVSNTSYELLDSADVKFRDHFSITITEISGQHVYGVLTVEEVAPGDY